MLNLGRGEASVSPSNQAHHIRGLRATRAYASDPLSRADATAILEAGRWTGSSMNSQPWIFLVVTEPELKQQLSEAGRYATHLASAPLVVVLVGEPGRGEFDLGRAAQDMMLAADLLGVGSCPATLHDEDQARHVLSIPHDRRCRHAIAFGYPDPGLEQTIRQNLRLITGSGRKSLDEVVRWNNFEQQSTPVKDQSPRE